MLFGGYFNYLNKIIEIKKDKIFSQNKVNITINSLHGAQIYIY